MKKRSLKSQMSLTIALVVFITVGLISISANVLINRQFKSYIVKQQQQETNELIANLSRQYDQDSRIWNLPLIKSIGMYALYEGYIIKVSQPDGSVIWDAEAHDMSLCTQVMRDISEQMQRNYPGMEGQFTSQNYDLVQGDQKVGVVSLNYYGPYFLNDNDFQFLKSLNIVLLGTGIFALMMAVAMGWMFAKRISMPITKTVMITKEIAAGNYGITLAKTTKTKELNELVDAVNHLTCFLKKQEELRKRMFADVAHELRTPLGIVSTHLEAMTEGLWEPTKERIQSCHEEINRITKLVKELEELAKVERDQISLNLQPVQLEKLLQTVCDNFETIIKNKDIKLQIHGSTPKVLADRDKITQVILNLLSNGIKYTPDHGEIDILLEELDQFSILKIRDNGVGISSEDLPFIFERFYRVDKSRNRKTGGAGIGLTIVKSIVTAHNGKVEAVSELGKGTCFTVYLPKVKN